MPDTEPKRKEGVVKTIRVEDNSFALALAVMRDRVSNLCEEDKNDLFELLPDLLNANCEEDRQAALVTAAEILNQADAGLVKVTAPEPPGEELQNWISFVSARIKSQREVAGLTQTELAKKAGIPQSHISRLEAGLHSPTAKTLEKIAKALNINASVFDSCAVDEEEEEEF